MDRDMGRLFDLLRELEIDQKTVVFFTSDNGPHREGPRPWVFDSNGPLKVSNAPCTMVGFALP